MSEHRTVVIARAIEASILETIWLYVENHSSEIEKRIKEDLKRKFSDITPEELADSVDCLYDKDGFDFDITVSDIKY